MTHNAGLFPYVVSPNSATFARAGSRACTLFASLCPASVIPGKNGTLYSRLVTHMFWGVLDCF